MTEAIIVALITGGLSLLGSALAVWAASRKQAEEFRIQQAVINEKLSSLTEEVREHNNFARRMPVVEEKIQVANHRIADLEEKVK